MTEPLTRLRTVLVPLLNVSVAQDLLSLAAGLIAGPDKFLPHQARVLVLAVVAVPEGHPPSEGRNMARAYRAMLGYLPATIRPPGAPPGTPDEPSDRPDIEVPVDTLIKVAPTVQQGIREAVSSEDVDLLLLHWKGYSHRARQHVYGRILDDLVENPPCNMLLARGSRWQTPRRILLPLRGGPAAELALGVGLKLASRLQVGVTVLHGVPRAMPAEVGRRRGDEPYLDLQRYLEHHSGRGTAVPIEQVLTLATDVPDLIAARAEAEDLLILGLGDRGPHQPLAGSPVLDSALADAERPVLLARAARPLDLAAYHARLSAREEISLSAEQWFVENTYHRDEFADTEKWLEVRNNRHAHLSVVIPTHNDAAHLGSMLVGLRRGLQPQRTPHTAGEILVIDAASDDDTAAVAAGYRFPVLRIPPDRTRPGSPGPAAQLAAALNIVAGDILVWIDPKAGRMNASAIRALAGPLLHDPGVLLSKPFWPEPDSEGTGVPEGRVPNARFAPIRVTDLLAMSVPELAALPLYSWLRAFYPRLGAVLNPLGSTFAARVSLLRDVLPGLQATEDALGGDDARSATIGPATAFAAGMLLETAALHSSRAIAQVEMTGSRRGPRGSQVANRDTRRLRQVAELLALFATRHDAIQRQAALEEIRGRILNATA
jgi:glucosyl-3-phosphoglycerate synthase